MDYSKQILSHFNLDAREDESLINFLNVSEKGGDTFVLQFGSHSIKFGLASQITPFMVPNQIAYPCMQANSKPLFEVPRPTRSENDYDDVNMHDEEESKIAAPLSDEDRV